MNTRIVGRFASKLLCHFARALLFTAGQVNQDCVPPRFQQIRIDRQRFVEGFHRGIVIACLAGAFNDSVRISFAECAMRQREGRIEISRAFKMSNCFVDVFARDRVIDEPAQRIASTQVCFVGLSVRSLGAFELVLFIGSQLKPQAIANLLRDRVLHINDVGRIRIDAITPEQISRVDVYQLRGHANAIARAQKTCGQHG